MTQNQTQPINLATLDKEHPMRNVALGEIGAEWRGNDKLPWRNVEPLRVSLLTYNQLVALHWRYHGEWRATAANEWEPA